MKDFEKEKIILELLFDQDIFTFLYIDSLDTWSNGNSAKQWQIKFDKKIKFISVKCLAFFSKKQNASYLIYFDRTKENLQIMLKRIFKIKYFKDEKEIDNQKYEITKLNIKNEIIIEQNLTPFQLIDFINKKEKIIDLIFDFKEVKIFNIPNTSCNILKSINYRGDFEFTKSFYQNKNYCNISYYDENKEYINNFLEDQKLNYFSSSFQIDNHGLNESHLNTLANLNYLIKNKNNKYLPINGAPGTGKSTILNYVISNILMDHFLNQIQNKKGNEIVKFLLEKYKVPNILVTGFTKNSVKNLSNICQYNPIKQHRWLELENKNLDDIFYCLDYESIKEIKENDEDQNKWLKVEKNYISKCTEIKKNINKIKEIFLYKAKNYLNDDIDESNLILKLLEKINENNRFIVDVNKIINIFVNYSNQIEKFDQRIKLIYLVKSLMDKIRYFILNLKNKKKKKWDLIKLLLKEMPVFDKLSEYFKTIQNFKYPNNKNLIEKIKLFFSTRKIISKKLKNIFKFLNHELDLLENKHLLLINEINYYLDFLEKKLGIKLLGSKNKIDEEEYSSLSNILSILSFGKNTKNNLHEIQKKLDIDFRSKNVYLYRHIHEWIFIKKMENTQIREWNNWYKRSLSYIKPIVSSNIQGIDLSNFNWYFLNWNNKNEIKEKFDYLIVDEAGQVDATNILFLNSIAKQIIAVGDEKQLEPIRFVDLKYQDIFTLASLLINDSEWITNFFKQFYFMNLENDTKLIENNSLLSWMNENCNIISTIYLNEKKPKICKGFYLLEHFRCPKSIFDVINKEFYENNLIFGGNASQTTCPLMDEIQCKEKIICNDSAWIDIIHKSENTKIDESENVNEFEIKLAIKFILKNINFFYLHYSNNINVDLEIKINELKNKIVFITFYRNQIKRFKEFVRNKKYIDIAKDLGYSNVDLDILEKIFDESSMKVGTIDSLQGIGCDFIIFSTVSDEMVKKNNSNNKDELRQHEFNKNRINVLWTRTKKHFINIVNDRYYDKWKFLNHNDTKTINTKMNVEKKSLEMLITRVIIKNNELRWDKNLIHQIEANEKDKTVIIGRYGEKFFNFLQNEFDTRYLLINKIKEQTKIDLDYENMQWMNKDKESNKPYDFVTKDKQKRIIYIDVKTSTYYSKKIYVSKNEQEFAINNIYIVARFPNIKNYYLNIKNQNIYKLLNELKFYIYNGREITNNFSHNLLIKIRD